MKRIACYGSLKRGYYNHDRFGKMDFIGIDYIRGLQLYLTGLPYPIGVKENGGSTQVEIFDISDEQFDKLNGMEVYAGYIEGEFKSRFGLASFWYQPCVPADSVRMLGVNWLGEKK